MKLPLFTATHGNVQWTQRRRDDCLLPHHLSLIASGDWHVDPGTTNHLAGCAACSDTLQEMRTEVLAAALEPLPASLRAALYRRSAAWSAIPLLGALSMACLLLLVQGAEVPDGVGPTTRVKGSAALLGTVLREQNFVAKDVRLEELRDLRAGDHLRLHLLGFPQGRVALQGWEEGAWVTYFDGDVPRDHWLPVGIGITEGQDTRLRLITCDAAPASDLAVAVDQGICKAREYAF